MEKRRFPAQKIGVASELNPASSSFGMEGHRGYMTDCNTCVMLMRAQVGSWCALHLEPLDLPLTVLAFTSFCQRQTDLDRICDRVVSLFGLFGLAGFCLPDTRPVRNLRRDVPLHCTTHTATLRCCQCGLGTAQIL